jgi:hypothetical protein
VTVGTHGGYKFYSDFQLDYLLKIIIASITRIRKTQTPIIAPTIAPTLPLSSFLLFAGDLVVSVDVVISVDLVAFVDMVVSSQLN